MSDNQAENEPLEAPLPSGLARCESRLAALPLPATTVQRDELLYRAGWAAARAEVLTTTQPATGRRVLAWSLVSAVVAASLAVIVTGQIEALPSRVAQQKLTEPPVAESVVARAPVADDSTALPPVRYSTVPRVLWSAGLLKMRDRTLRRHWSGTDAVMDHAYVERASGTSPALRPSTSRELLRDFLPATQSTPTIDHDFMRPSFPWPWSSRRPGATT